MMETIKNIVLAGFFIFILGFMVFFPVLAAMKLAIFLIGGIQ